MKTGLHQNYKQKHNLVEIQLGGKKVRHIHHTIQLVRQFSTTSLKIAQFGIDTLLSAYFCLGLPETFLLTADIYRY